MESQGMINVYQCPKGHKTVTVNRDDGTTPMMLRCRQKDDDGKHNCTEFAKSSWYMVDQTLLPEYEWYKPVTMKGLDQEEREHVKLGGLLIRKIVITKPA